MVRNILDLSSFLFPFSSSLFSFSLFPSFSISVILVRIVTL